MIVEYVGMAKEESQRLQSEWWRRNMRTPMSEEDDAEVRRLLHEGAHDIESSVVGRLLASYDRERDVVAEIMRENIGFRKEIRDMKYGTITMAAYDASTKIAALEARVRELEAEIQQMKSDNEDVGIERDLLT